MATVSIPFALSPHGKEVPIKEAIRFKTDYYVCPECGEFVTPRKGEIRDPYFAHKRGTMEDTDCELSSQQDVDQIVDELRTSDVEKEESQRLIRTYLGEEPGGTYKLFGVIPSIDRDNLPPNTDIDGILEECSVDTHGVIHPPTANSFHPAEPEVIFELDPTETDYSLTFKGPSLVDKLVGQWTTDPLTDGDIFVGDQTRARRFSTDRQLKDGEWVYLITESQYSADIEAVSVHSLVEWTLLGFPARKETESLLEEFGTGLKTDEYGFEADVILPAEAHPTADKPIIAEPKTTVLISVTPAPDLDPVFEIVSVPKRDADTVELEPTGPGNPRFYKTAVPRQGSKRVSVHQRNSSRHRLIHLHADDRDTHTVPEKLQEATIALQYNHENDTKHLTPFGDNESFVIETDVQPMALSTALVYDGPAGIEVEVTAYFPEGHSEAPFMRRAPDSLSNILPNLGHWVTQGCTKARFWFDGIGSITLEFAHNSPETAVSEGRE